MNPDLKCYGVTRNTFMFVMPKYRASEQNHLLKHA